MKKLLLLCTLIGSLAFVSCDLSKENDEPDYEEWSYVGDLTVIPLGNGDTYTWKNSEVGLVWERDNTITLWLYNTRFVPQMPLMTMAVPHITYAETPSLISMLGDNIDPYIGGTPYKQYRITSLSGTVAGDMLNISFNCMGHRVTFIGYEID